MLLALFVAALWAALAPPERSLGEGIRVVYLHVSATQAGLFCLYGVGLAGLVAALLPRGRATLPLPAFWTAGLVAFGAGFLLSLVSATVSWGGVFWAEPRVRASLGVVAVGLVAQAVHGALGGRRIRHLTWPVSALIMFLVLRAAPLYMHPDRPVQSTTPLGIRAAFIGIFVLFLVASFCLALVLGGSTEERRPSPE